ncbi:hypothetical protein J2X31_001074 [Flavobacterium arsenatis]|uniref:Uncharacterized protein n=1 Tax=Flavobacterium arsenatis TaxID=1484332 RepID=A0ABU1TM78_9FLAO|nr:hypothetical protein [Flavobacterium arsenatis]MDR6967074.1 hypothetical protein [Flavobacterium arsenatis]
MTSNTKERPIESESELSFNYNITGALKDFVKLRLFDGKGNNIASGYQNLNIRLTKGLYQVQVQTNEKIENKFLRVENDFNESWEYKGSYSSIPDTSFKSSHEYYSETSKFWSQNTTVRNGLHIEGNDPGDNYNAVNRSLFIFFRYPDRETRDSQKNVAASMGWRFTLADSNRKPIFRLKGDDIREDTIQGWMAFNAKLPAGIYYLIYNGNGKRKREIPLYIFGTWQTQLFITFKQTPIFQTTRILLARPYNGQNFNENETQILDAVLQKMQNGRYFVPPDLIRRTAHEKWENPMLGIVVCYAYLLSRQTSFDELFRVIINNLENNILSDHNSPDIMAIKLLAALHYSEPIPKMELESPCMIMAGMRAFLENSVRHSDAISINTQLEDIIPVLKNDSVWTSYLPMKMEKYKEPNAGFEQHLSIKPSIKNYISYNDFHTISIDDNQLIEQQGKAKQIAAKDWVAQSLITQLSIATTDNKWLNLFNISVDSLALQYQVEAIIIRRKLQELLAILDNSKSLFLQTYGKNIDSDVLKLNIDKLLKT